ncbi:Uncharacterised protein [Bordetella pertussis]|nr:Uncharacterised protein [Bordetella pertussis]
MSGRPRQAASELISAICPWPRARMAGSRPCTVAWAARRLVSITMHTSSQRSPARSGPMSILTSALMMARSGGCVAFTSSSHASRRSVARMSKAATLRVAPRSRHSPTSSSSRPRRRPCRISRTPGAAYSSASARPISPLAPVSSTHAGQFDLIAIPPGPSAAPSGVPPHWPPLGVNCQ